MTKSILFTFKDDLAGDLADRSRRMVKSGPPIKLEGVNRSVQFLRGVFSRASLCVPAFYYFLGSASARESASSSSDHSFRVAQSYSEFSDLNTLTLSCRKIFDNASKRDLTGGNFAKTTDAVLLEHAAYWAKTSGRNPEECATALRFLRRFFGHCSMSESQLLRASGQLQRRIGLLTQHANRAAAHLSLDDYAIDLADVAHFTAACVVVGEIVRSFDNPHLGSSYFADLDIASYRAARRVFPSIAEFQLFALWNIENQARFYWQAGDDGIDVLLNRVQHAVGGRPKG